MVSPVGSNQFQNSPPPAPIESRPATFSPAGVGETQTNLEAPKAHIEQKGYVERGVLAMVDFIKRLFAKLSSYFYPTPSPSVSKPSPSVSKSPVEKVPEAPKESYPLLIPEIQKKVEALRQFNQLSPEAQKLICRDIGKKSRRWFSVESDRELGEAKLAENPEILDKYILNSGQTDTHS